MGDSDLIFDHSEFVMGSLFRFDGAKSGEVLFHGDSPGIFPCEAGGITGDRCPSGAHFAEVLGAPVPLRFRMIDRTGHSMVL